MPVSAPWAADESDTAGYRYKDHSDEGIKEQSSPAASVEIQTRDVPGRKGRPPKAERYPFGKLEPVSIDARGRLSGQCFFIPEADNPARRIAAGRKRHRPKVFITRKAPGGRMVWREK